MVQAAATGNGGPVTRTRDAALILTLASTAARSEEISAVQIRHTFLPESRLWLGTTKSSQPRNGWLHPSAVDALERWIALRGPNAGGLFVPLSRTGRALLNHGHLSGYQIRKIVRARGKEAGLGEVTAHDLRRFVTSTLLDRGVDVVMVAAVVGHKNPATTAGYDRRPAQRQRDAVATLDLPPMPPSDPESPAVDGQRTVAAAAEAPARGE